jgi:hypothetical protein
MFGTDLSSAFGTFDNAPVNDMMMPSFSQDLPVQQPQQQRSSHEIMHKSTPLTSLGQQSSHANEQPLINLNQMSQQQSAPTQVQQPIRHQPSPLQPTGNQDPRITLLLNELKKQQMITANMQEQTGYIDRLFSKKKDMLKVLQLALVIVLAMSIHFIVDHYLRNYIKNNDLSFERELVIRLLYPFALLFILWNMKAFVK